MARWQRLKFHTRPQGLSWFLCSLCAALLENACVFPNTAGLSFKISVALACGAIAGVHRLAGLLAGFWVGDVLWYLGSAQPLWDPASGSYPVLLSATAVVSVGVSQLVGAKRLAYTAVLEQVSSFAHWCIYTLFAACLSLLALIWTADALFVQSVFLSYGIAAFVVLPLVLHLWQQPKALFSPSLLDLLIVSAVVFFIFLRVEILDGKDFYKYVLSILVHVIWIASNRLDRVLTAWSLNSLYIAFSVFLCLSGVPYAFEVLLLYVIFAAFLTGLATAFYQEVGQNDTIHRRVQERTDALYQANEALERSRALLIQEQLSAKKIFDRLVHAGALHRPDIRFRLSPHSIFNGDVLLAQEKPDGTLCLFLGDFTGHGLPAAMGIMPCSEIFYSMVKKGFAIEQIIPEINRKLGEVLPEGIFCAAVAFEVRSWERMIRCWNGGIPAPVLFDESGRIRHRFESRNIPLGFFKNEHFDPKFEWISFDMHDRLLFFSDGVLEAKNPEGVLFGNQRIEALFNGQYKADTIFQHLIEHINAFQAQSAASERDDLTIAQLHLASVELPVWKSLQQESTADCRSEQAAIDWGFSIQAGPQALQNLDPVPLIMHCLLETPCLAAHKERLFLILSELYANALEHGVLGLDSRLKSAEKGLECFYEEKAKRLAELSTGYVHIEVYIASGTLRITLRDSGKGFDASKVFSSLEGNMHPSGRGVALLQHLCDTVEYEAGGSVVHVSYRW